MLDKILQQQCRRKAAKKLAATLLSAPTFRFPTELSAEQCTSDDLAEFHASLIPRGSNILDLTAGLGIDAFHMARRAVRVVAIERNPDVAAAIGPNATALGLGNVAGICADSTEWLCGCNERFDVAFIDPSRRAADGSRLYSLGLCEPNVLDLLDSIERIAPRLIIKASPMLDINRTIGELRNVASVYAVGTRSECKELLIDIDFARPGMEARIYGVTIGFPTVELKRAEPVYADTLEVGDIIGEPWPAVMKIRPNGQWSGQLHPSTLLFRNPGEDFPGTRYRLMRIEDFSSSNVRRLAREKISASVATRNFPLTADLLRQKLKATENSALRLMATTLYPDRQKLLFLSANFAKNV